MTGKGTSFAARLRLVVALNVAVWAMLAFTIGLLCAWIKPNDGFQLMGLLMAGSFTLVSIAGLFRQ
ncbi:MAG: hypothetical protein ABFD69_04505 [Candidatus Sumerlaeia bacterium]